mmetsp:Transcript_30870/g.55257  ORF Transcript_30870/g.55257 Transcript_30870/m.55257 type:complete len:240 (-) Transcript_30870:40-759(-)
MGSTKGVWATYIRYAPLRSLWVTWKEASLPRHSAITRIDAPTLSMLTSGEQNIPRVSSANSLRGKQREPDANHQHRLCEVRSTAFFVSTHPAVTDSPAGGRHRASVVDSFPVPTEIPPHDSTHGALGPRTGGLPAEEDEGVTAAKDGQWQHPRRLVVRNNFGTREVRRHPRLCATFGTVFSRRPRAQRVDGRQCALSAVVIRRMELSDYGRHHPTTVHRRCHFRTVASSAVYVVYCRLC